MSAPSRSEQPPLSGNSHPIRKSAASVLHEDGATTAAFVTGRSRGEAAKVLSLPGAETAPAAGRTLTAEPATPGKKEP
jgi:hypothetical protein